MKKPAPNPLEVFHVFPSLKGKLLLFVSYLAVLANWFSTPTCQLENKGIGDGGAAKS